MQIRSKSEQLWPVFPRVEMELAAWDMEMEHGLKLRSSISWKHIERRKKKFNYKGKDGTEKLIQSKILKWKGISINWSKPLINILFQLSLK